MFEFFKLIFFLTRNLLKCVEIMFFFNKMKNFIFIENVWFKFFKIAKLVVFEILFELIFLN